MEAVKSIASTIAAFVAAAAVIYLNVKIGLVPGW